MADSDLFASTLVTGKGARTKRPSKILMERAAQSAAYEAEYNKKTGHKPKSNAKENRRVSGDARVEASRKQIVSKPVALPALRTITKPRAAVNPRAAAQLPQLQTPRPASTQQRKQQQQQQDTPEAQAQDAHLPEDDGADIDDEDADAALETAAPLRRPRAPRQARGQGRKPPPRGGDLPLVELRFVERAYPPMRALVSIDPFNTKEENEKKVATAIARAREANDQDKELLVTDEMFRLILARAAQLQGDVKRVADNKTAAHFRLISSCKSKIRARNKKTVEDLLNEDGFMYKNTEERLGLYRQPCISDIINSVWFSARNKEGPLFPNIFNQKGDGIPAQIIALVLTAMYSSLLQWETGSFNQVKFSEARFHGEYLDILEDLRTHAKVNPDLYRKLCRDLYKAGIAHAGVVIQARVRSGLKAADFERAALMDSLDSDDDSDGEESVRGHGDEEDVQEPAVGDVQEPAAEDIEADQPPVINEITAWFRQAVHEREADNSNGTGADNSVRRPSKRKQNALDSGDEGTQDSQVLTKRRRATELPVADDADGEDAAVQGETDELDDRDKKILKNERLVFTMMSREERDEVIAHMRDIGKEERAAAGTSAVAAEAEEEEEEEEDE
ncbi:hypothetical protein AURDEDRAFT_153542 [Auricularia subglabra TFB-10046 SS5]|nr:hypothetical protein AURDEDRAFT_153542 [Auricularia subglabra TFB-10046 SS5]